MASIVGGRILQLVDNVSELSGGIGANGKLLRKAQVHSVYGVQVAFPHAEPVMEMQGRQVAMSEYSAGLIDPMTYYEAAGYENGSDIKQRLMEESVRQLPSVRQKIEQAVAQQMGLVDEENQEAAMAEIAQRQQAMAPQIPGMNGAGPMGPGGGAGPADINTPLTPDTFNPERIDLAR
tara:strand:- start:80 stop:613 length:534 start_codon:yes stop_codon:yes gene_type:complete